MASHGGDDGGRWGGSPATERVPSAYLDEDDPVTLRDDRPDPPGRSTDKNWSPGGEGPATRPRDHGKPLAIFDGPTSGDDDADVTQRRFAIRDRHGTLPIEQVLIPSAEHPPITAAPVGTPHPPTPRIMPPPTPQPPTPQPPPPQPPPPQPPYHPPAPQVLPNPLQPSSLQQPNPTTLQSEPDAPSAEPWAPPPAFSDRPPWEQEEPPPKKRGLLLAGLLAGAVVLGGGAFALGWLLKPATESEPDHAPPTASDDEPRGEPTGTASPSATATAEAAAPSSEPAVPSAAAPSAEASATAEAPDAPAEPTESELAELLSYEGYLTVTSTADAEVYVQGKHIGPTNKRLVSKCYQRFVRLKKGTDGEWVTPGRPVRIACMSSTTVEINPE